MNEITDIGLTEIELDYRNQTIPWSDLPSAGEVGATIAAFVILIAVFFSLA